MQIGNIKIDWKQKKQIGIVVMRLEIKNADWKHKKQIGNKKSRWETKKKDIGNNLLRLETQSYII